MHKPILIGATILATLIAFAPRSFAGGDESTWGPVPLHQAYKKALVRDPVTVAPPSQTWAPVRVLPPTVAIMVDEKGEPVCDYRRQMFAGRSDLYWRYCNGMTAEATAEPSDRNDISPQ